MKNLNEKYEGAGGQSFANPIQGFNESRKVNKDSMLGRIMDKFGSSLKEFFVQNISIESYTRALVDLIQYTYYIEEWLKSVLDLKLQQQKLNKQLNQNDKISLDHLKKVSKFLQDVVMVIVLNDIKYMLTFYMIGMQNAMVEDFTLTQQRNMQRE